MRHDALPLPKKADELESPLTNSALEAGEVTTSHEEVGASDTPLSSSANVAGDLNPTGWSNPSATVNCNINEIYHRQVDVVYRVCLSYMKNKADTEDCVSDTFMNLIKADPVFNSVEHEKAWLIRVAANVCKNNLKHWSRRNSDIDDYEDQIAYSGHPTPEEIHENRDILDAVQSLPEDYRAAVYLYYYEGYTSREISETLKRAESTVRSHLKKAKLLLKEKLKDYNYSIGGE